MNNDMMKKKNTFVIYIVMIFAVLFTKVLGLLRGVLLSSAYGTGMEANAFHAISALPLNIFDVTVGTAITAAFIPVFNERLTKSKNKSAANHFASNFLNIVLCISLLLVIFGVLFPKSAVLLVASGFEGEVLELSLTLVRILMPIIAFACCAFVSIGILQSYGQFVAPALVSLFSNLAMIFYFLVLNKTYGIIGLAIAYSFGWLLQFLFLLPFLKTSGYRYKPVFNLRSSDIKKVAILTLPLFAAALAQPINQLISTNFSSKLADGSGVSTISYAYSAYLIVAGVFSSALTNLFFPELSRRFAVKDNKGASTICNDMLKAISTIILPVMAFLAANAAPIIQVLYQRGEFTEQDTKNVAALLVIYTCGMLFLSWQDILCKMFYSMQKSFVPMIVSVIGIGVNFFVAYTMSRIIGVSGLALSTVIAGAVMTCFFLLFILKYAKEVMNIGLFICLFKNLAAAVIMFFCAKYVRLWAVSVIGGERTLERIAAVLISFVAALAVYLVVLLLLRSKELGRLGAVFKKEREH